MYNYYLVPVSCTGRLNSYNIPFFEKYPHVLKQYKDIVQKNNESKVLLGSIAFSDEYILCFSEYDCKEDSKIEYLCQAFYSIREFAEGKICIPSYMADQESVEWLCRMNFKEWEVSDFV